MLEHVKTYVRHSKESGCSKDLNCCATVDLIEQKLTDSLARNLRRWMFREHREKRVNVEFLVTFLNNETELEERLHKSYSIQTNRQKHVSVNKLHANNSCLLCGKERHKFVDCEKFISCSPKQRTEAMKRLGRCFTCLSSMHPNPKNCKYRCACLNCGKSHHIMLDCVPTKPITNLNDKGTPNQSVISLNASVPPFEPVIPEVKSADLNSKCYGKHAPVTYVDLLGNDGKWHKLCSKVQRPILNVITYIV